MRACLTVVYIAIIVSLIGGCTGYGTYVITSESVPRTNANDIHVYSTTEPDVDYQVLAYISVYVTNAQDAGNQLRDELKERAAQIGADAIITFKLNLEPTGGGGAEGIAIKFK
jgi:hypothetical protein